MTNDEWIGMLRQRIRKIEYYFVESNADSSIWRDCVESELSALNREWKEAKKDGVLSRRS
jgi:hypothetical protein